MRVCVRLLKFKKMFYLIEFLNIGNLDVAAEKNLVQIFKKIKIVPGH